MPGIPAHSSSPAELSERFKAEREGQPFIVFRDGSGVQQIKKLDGATAPVAIGRRTSCDLALDWDDEISRLHAELEYSAEQWVIADDGLSQNGTFVNGERVSSRRRLADGDVITVGTASLNFFAPHQRKSLATASGAKHLLRADLTDAQRRVLVALCRPCAGQRHTAPASTPQIAAELVLSKDAVKTHLKHLFRKLGIDDLPQNQKRAALVDRAFQTGLVTDADFR